MLPEVSRCGKHESGVPTPRNPIDRPGTNGNRAQQKQAFLNNLDAGNMNPKSKHLENSMVGWEPTADEFTGKSPDIILSRWNN